ncbi:MAG: TrkH family potassium uptake protein [Gammaproteobacteria bacterium]|nr:TrkH family potassium uptake protein [Gammaproteobacteria bacterium]MDH4316517.1 TrkH family potassium uptake protein [Gammaproteobacteria bacterium]MDH5215549.1 TrkH family potassium uptake protein [Gammaproteobacteria bacterium]MDH5500834.1 TrkH family potassium uptake protein [Gammaproteobacteria bacterium]
MNWTVVQRILGLLLMMFSLTMLPPVGVSIIYSDPAWLPFVESFLLTLFSGLVIWFPVRRSRKDLRLRDGFLVVASFWSVLGTFGALPFYLTDIPQMSFIDSLFESMSGLTTTGATVLTGLDGLPNSILWYRQQLQWLGGMGIIVLAVAVLPMLGVGGMQLYRAETPGPVKDTKLTPRITETAKALWYVYLAFTITCTVGYKLAGMGWFDAVSHAFSTVAIGGFSTHDLSIGHFESTTIDLIAVFFMFAAGINFSLHFFAWRFVQIKHYSRDPEFRAYVFILLIVSAIVIVSLSYLGVYAEGEQNFVNGLFQAVSIATTTGFTTVNFSQWPGALPVLLIFASFIGGSAGSTAGGMKVIRWLLIYKQGVREISRLIHPSAEIPVKLGASAVPVRVVDAVWGFFSVYVVVFGAMLLAMMATGLDQVTAFSAVAATLNNLGPGLGDVASGFMTVNDPAKWIAIVGMLLGRLEIFTLLVLFTPVFWRH